MIRWIGIGALLAVLVPSPAEAARPQGKITYIAAGSVYLSFGRDAGVQDSSLLRVVRGQDTIAILKVFALSSKSAAATVLSSVKKLLVGDIVIAPEPVASVAVREAVPPPKPDSAGSAARPVLPSAAVDTSSRRPQPPAVVVKGRTSLQYLTMTYDDPASNYVQPAAVLNLQLNFRDVPLTFDLNGLVRSLTLGSGRPFAPGSADQSRIYRLALQYRGESFGTTIGRFVPFEAPMIGYVDGVLLSERVGQFNFGSVAGFQTRSTLNGLSTSYTKYGVFASFQSTGPVSATSSVAYTRNYFERGLDREVVSGFASIYAVGGISLYANGEVDLRRKAGDQFLLWPQITSGMVNINIPAGDLFTFSLGADMSRPFMEYSLVRLVPDTLLDRTLRTGFTAGIMLSPARGVNVMETFMPRSSLEGFAKEYTNASAIVFSNVFSTGVLFRTNFTMTANLYTSSDIVGFNAQKFIANVVQVSVNYQRARYLTKSLGTEDFSNSIGSDILWIVSKHVSAVLNLNRLDGFGRVSRTVFAELSYRF